MNVRPVDLPGMPPVFDAPLLDVRGLGVAFDTDGGRVDAVSDVSLRVGRGETLGIVGESGSGKSVTMQAVMGLIRQPPGRVVAGEAIFAGRDLLKLSDAAMRKIRGRDIAMIFQDPMSSLNPVLTIGRQLTEGIEEHRGLSRHTARREALAMLERVGIANASARLDNYPHQFSGGQLQRVGIAMALICKPSLLIADEPTTALDVTVQAQIVELVVGLQKEFGMAVIWISHDLGLVAGFVARVAVMYAGGVVETAPVDQLFRQTAHPYTLGLLNAIPAGKGDRRRLEPIKGSPPNLTAALDGCAFAPRCALAFDRCRRERPTPAPVSRLHRSACFLTAAEARERMSKQRTDGGAMAAAAHEAATTILTLNDVKVHFPIWKGVLRRQVGVVKAVDGVSLTVRAGETLALVGESGCGKSTTGRAIIGLNALAGGEIVIEGRNYAGASEADLGQRRRAVQMIFQNPYGSLNPRLTIGRIIGEGLRAHRIGNRRSQEARVSELLALVGLPEAFRRRYPHELSGGQRQRVGIARALATEPKLIVADEPISALDVSIQAQVINLLDDLKRRLGLTYVFIGHDLSMIRHVSDRVAVMYLGRIVEIGDTHQVFANPRHPYTRALLSAIPVPDPRAAGAAGRIILGGAVPDPANPPAGCAFHPRCPQARDLCRVERPELTGGSGSARPHRAACHDADDPAEAIA